MKNTSQVDSNVSSDALCTADIAFFEREGYLIFPRLLTPAHSERVMRDIDRLQAQRTGGYAQRNSEENGTALIITFPHLGGLTCYPPMVAKVASLMGGCGFALHHQHANLHSKGTPPSNWHHDYEQFPQTDRDQLMVHCFYYPNGLNGEAGDLLVLPRSHKSVMHNNAFSGLFYAKDLPGSVTIDELPRGSAVIVHSALLHARRAKPGGLSNPRYFTDVSYCQAGDQKWPAYGFPLPKLALHKRVGQRAREAGHGREGKFDFLYATDMFYDMDTATEPQRVAMEWRAKQGRKNRSVRERTQ